MKSSDAADSVEDATKALTIVDAALSPLAAHKPHLLVLVGVPGSGKSTVAERLRKEAGWAVVSQDVLGDRRACESATAKYLRQGRNVVVDRCNFDVRQRATWLQVGCAVCGGPGGFVPMTLRLATDLEECQQRTVSRTDHPTLNGPASAAVINRFREDFVGPKAAESFAARYVARSPAEVELLLPLLIAAGKGGATPAVVPASLQDSDADPCYGGSARAARPRPAWQQRGRPRGVQRHPSAGRNVQPFDARGRGWQPAARPWPQGGQLWQPPQQQPATGSGAAGGGAAGGIAAPGSTMHTAPEAPLGSTSHWRSDGQGAPHGSALQHATDDGASVAGGWHMSGQFSGASGPAVPAWSTQQTMTMQLRPSAPVTGWQRPSPYRPPGW